MALSKRHARSRSFVTGPPRGVLAYAVGVTLLLTACRRSGATDGTDPFTFAQRATTRPSGWRMQTAIAVGVHMACAIEMTGRVNCWGAFTSRETGDRTERRYLAPTPVPEITDAVEVSVGSSHACARTVDGRVRCWGENTYGQLGDGTTRDADIPVAVAGLDGVEQLALGSWFSCARLRDRTVRCWGRRIVAAGHPDGGTAALRAEPIAGLAQIVDLDARGDRVCVADEVGGVLCVNADRGVTSGENVFRSVGGIAAAVDVEVGERFACARTRDGYVLCWGADDHGQLGGEPGDAATDEPRRMLAITDATAIALGDDHACATQRDGRFVCWGGGVGGSNVDTSRPLIVDATPDTTALALGHRFTCLLRTPVRAAHGVEEFDLRCLGENVDGQLGNDRPGFVDRPTRVTFNPSSTPSGPGIARIDPRTGLPVQIVPGRRGADDAASACVAVPAILNAPLSRVVACRAVSTELGIVDATVIGPDAPEPIVPRRLMLANGHRVSGDGGRDLLRFMRERRIFQLERLDAQAATALVDVFHALPPGFAVEHWDFHESGAGYSYFLRNPFTLVLVRRGRPELREPAFIRVMLHGGENYLFFWEFEHLDVRNGPWRVVDRYGLDRDHPAVTAAPPPRAGRR